MNEVTDPALLAMLNAPETGSEVTDPALLEQLNSEVTDPEVLAQLNAPQTANTDAANAAIAQAVEQGRSRVEIENIARQNGVDPASLSGIDEAIAFRKKYGRYGGTVETGRTFDSPPTPQVAAPGQEDRGAVDASLRGAADSLSFGFSDEIGAGFGAATNSLSNLVGEGTGESFGDYYTRSRDDQRASLASAQENHPYAFAGGQIAGGLGTLFVPGAGASTLGRLAIRGAAEGALYGTGSADGSAVDRLIGGARGAAIGGAVAPVAGAAARVISPTVSRGAQRLLDRNIPLTPGQILGSNGGAVGTIAREAEQSLKSLPVVGGLVGKAEDRAVTEFNRQAAGYAAGHNVAQRLRPEQYVEKARRMVESDVFNAVDDQALSRAALADRRVRFLENNSDAVWGRASPVDLYASSRRGGVDPSFRNWIADAAEVMGESDGLVTRGGNYIDGLVGNIIGGDPRSSRGAAEWAKRGLRTLTGGAVASIGGIPAVAGATVAGLLYTRPGQALARSALTGSWSGAAGKAARDQITRLAPRFTPVTGSNYDDRFIYTPNIEGSINPDEVQ